jgi:hypothetical protein
MTKYVAFVLIAVAAVAAMPQKKESLAAILGVSVMLAVHTSAAVILYFVFVGHLGRYGEIRHFAMFVFSDLMISIPVQKLLVERIWDRIMAWAGYR